MPYHLEGRLLEVCNCRVLCPCWIGEDPDFGTCDTIVAWHFDKGTIDGVDVTGRTIAMIAHVPGNILQGNWTAAVYVDDGASPAQAPQPGAAGRDDPTRARARFPSRGRGSDRRPVESSPELHSCRADDAHGRSHGSTSKEEKNGGGPPDRRQACGVEAGCAVAPDVQPTDEALDRGLRSKCQDSPDRDICVRQRFLARQQRGRRQLTLNECAVTYG